VTPLAADLTIGQDAYLLLGAGLFAIGLVGLMVRKSVLIMVMCVELMLNAVNITLVSFSQTLNDRVGQMTVFFVMVGGSSRGHGRAWPDRGVDASPSRRHRRRHFGTAGLS
jgi:NADH:ubiquinone oxidoreductase subunit K